MFDFIRLKRLIPAGLRHRIKRYRRTRQQRKTFLARVKSYMDVRISDGAPREYQLSMLRMYAHILDKGLHSAKWMPGRSLTVHAKAKKTLAELTSVPRVSEDPSFEWCCQVIEEYEAKQANQVTEVISHESSADQEKDDSTLLRLLRKRTSVRNFDPNRRMTKADAEAMATAALEAPSSCHRQTFRMYGTIDPEWTPEIGKCFHGFTCYSDFVPGLFVFCADLRPYSFPEELFTPAVDTALAVENAVLAANDRGIFVTLLNWAPTLERESKLRQLLGIAPFEGIFVGAACGFPTGVTRRPARKSVSNTLVLKS